MRRLAFKASELIPTGRFDKTLDKEEAVIGKKGARGIKRKFEPNEVSASDEREGALKLLKTLDKDPKGKRRAEPVLNTRKAIKEVTRGAGPTAFSAPSKRGKGKKRA